MDWMEEINLLFMKSEINRQNGMKTLLAFADVNIVNIKQHTKLRSKWKGTIEQHLKGAGGPIDNTEASSRHVNIQAFIPSNAVLSSPVCLVAVRELSRYCFYQLDVVMSELLIRSSCYHGEFLSVRMSFVCDKEQGDTDAFPLVIFYCCSVRKHQLTTFTTW